VRIIPKKLSPGAATDSFAAACRARGLSVTHQRLAIYESVISTDTHPGAEEIYQRVRARFPTISRGTVYRTLDTLCAMGLVTDVNRTAGAARFEAALSPHHHLVCLGCRRILDLHDESLQRLPARAEKSAATAGFEITGFQVQFTGYCRDCAGAGRPQRSIHPRTKKEAGHGKRA
jgi:Fur family peroxide stress response transcriptional regulator